MSGLACINWTLKSILVLDVFQKTGVITENQIDCIHCTKAVLQKLGKSGKLVMARHLTQIRNGLSTWSIT